MADMVINAISQEPASLPTAPVSPHKTVNDLHMMPFECKALTAKTTSGPICMVADLKLVTAG